MAFSDYPFTLITAILGIIVGAAIANLLSTPILLNDTSVQTTNSITAAAIVSSQTFQESFGAVLGAVILGLPVFIAESTRNYIRKREESLLN